jgi:hypothetical protein
MRAGARLQDAVETTTCVGVLARCATRSLPPQFPERFKRLLAGEMVSGDEINAQYPGRASSGIALILSAIPLFESSRIDGTQKIRMRVDQSG